MKKKLWLSAFTQPGINATFEWMVELDLSKTFKFVELPNGGIGFTQVDQKESNEEYKQSIIQWLEGEKDPIIIPRPVLIEDDLTTSSGISNHGRKVADSNIEASGFTKGFNQAIDIFINHIKEQ